MCFHESRVGALNKWNWDGDHIIHDSTVPSSRPPVGHTTGGYDIDAREFLVSERNTVMRNTLAGDVRRFIETKLPGASWPLFCSREPGSFDHRAEVIAEFVAQRIRYDTTDGLDPWQFPDETLYLKNGDCEDRALLIASLLLASGVSSFNVRVALGSFRVWFGRKHKDIDHVWVMYKSEAGRWQVIEPAQTRKHNAAKLDRAAMPDRADYIPRFLFNDVHLWQVDHPSTDNPPVKLKRDWSRVHPQFAGWVHKSILNEALGDENICPHWVLEALNRHFVSFFWNRDLTVDEPDMPGTYDPREHFDNGYIEDGWRLVQDRLGKFCSDSLGELDSFHLAAHAIADFYAHSSYAHFAAQGGVVPVYDPASWAGSPDYGAGSSFDLSAERFSRNANLWTGSGEAAAHIWQGRIISGRYGQKGDSKGIIESITFIPRQFTNAKDFAQRGALPHHNEIAVDDDKPGTAHRLYSKDEYKKQYEMRRDAAVRHIRQAFTENWKGTALP